MPITGSWLTVIPVSRISRIRALAATPDAWSRLVSATPLMRSIMAQPARSARMARAAALSRHAILLRPPLRQECPQNRLLLGIFDAGEHLRAERPDRLRTVERHLFVHLAAREVAGLAALLQDGTDLRREVHRPRARLRGGAARQQARREDQDDRQGTRRQQLGAHGSILLLLLVPQRLDRVLPRRLHRGPEAGGEAHAGGDGEAEDDRPEGGRGLEIE